MTEEKVVKRWVMGRFGGQVWRADSAGDKSPPQCVKVG
jgi:membrane protein implicated in regulation of membrane protease activity